jgi:hypothetical protein
MKKLLFIALISVGAAGLMQSCKKETPNGGDQPLTVANKQRSLLIYSTATWCGPCGASGGPVFKNAINAMGTDDLICLDLHPALGSLSMLTPIALRDDKPADSVFFAPFSSQLYGACLPNGYIPHFYCDNSVLGNSGVTVEQIKDFASSYNANVAPQIGVALNATASGNDINIKYKMKALNADGGDYYTSLVVIEKSFNGYQNVSGVGNTAVDHKNIVRGSAKYSSINTSTTPWTNAPVAFGDVEMSNPTNGTEIEKTAKFTYKAPSQGFKDMLDGQIKPQIGGYGFGWWNFNKSNTAVVAIVWKKEGTSWFYVNSAYADVK